MQFDPTARVGQVQMVRPADSLAAVTGIPVDEVKQGDTIVFTDARQSPIANGTITHIDRSTSEIVVEYTPTDKGRAPVKFDLAVFMKGH